MRLLLLISILLMCSCSSNLSAQKIKNWDEGIENLEKEDFILEYSRIKELIETDVRAFKVEVKNGIVTNSDLEIVTTSFEETKTAFDQILDKMKYGFTMKSNRKKLKKNPELFTEAFHSDLDEAYKSYQNNCQNKMNAMTASFDGAFGLSEITLILSLAKEIYSMINDNIEKTKKMSEEYFELNFISKLRLKDWDGY